MTSNVSLLLQILIQNGLEHTFAQKSPITDIDRYNQDFDDGCDLNIFDEDTCKMSWGHAKKRNALRCPKWLWPEGVIPYKSLLKTPDMIEKFDEAIREMNSLGCVEFKRIDSDGDIQALARMKKKHLTVSEVDPIPGKSCHASLGATGRRPYMALSRICTRGQILHELMHVLGFAHEHQRPDRDRYVKVQCDHIMPNVTQDFRRLRPHVMGSLEDEPYDFQSIMHYRLDHFSIDGQLTLVPVDLDLIKTMGLKPEDIGRMQALSDSDIRRIRKLYQC